MLMQYGSSIFSNLLADPRQMAFWMVVTVVLGFLVCSRGLQNGLEKISKVMMSALLILIVVLAVHSFTLSGAGEGIEVLSDTKFRYSFREVGIEKCNNSSYESGILYFKPWCGSNGDFRKLYGKRAYACRRRQYESVHWIPLLQLMAGLDYFSGMLQLWSGGWCRT